MSIKNRHKLFILFFSIFFVFFFNCCSTNNTFATEDAWIGEGPVEGNPTGGDSEGTGGAKCDADTNKWWTPCSGTSWIFYRAKGKELGEYTQLRRPIAYGVPTDKTKIPSKCSEHIDKNGGFWHFGINGNGMRILYWKGSYGINLWEDEYRWHGHWTTLNYGTGSRYVKNEFIPTAIGNPQLIGGSDINGVDDGIYVFDHIGSYDEVFKAYKQALKAAGKEDNVEGFSGSLWGFCWWEDMDKNEDKKYTLTIKAKAIPENTNWEFTGESSINKLDSLDSIMPPKTTTWNPGDNAEDTANDLSTKGYKLIGWFNGKSYWGSNSYKYTFPNIYENRTATAIYTKTTNVTLNLIAVDTSGNPLGEEHNKSSACAKNTKCSVTADSISGYTLKHWGKSRDNLTWKTASTSRVYEETISSNITRYAVYEGSGPEDDVIPAECPVADSINMVRISVRNASVERYQEWSDWVYAKPYDKLEYCGTYNPSQPQSYYSKLVDKDSSCYDTGVFHQELSNWNNAFSVQLDRGTHDDANFFSSTTVKDYTNYSLGDTQTHTETNDETVLISDAGKSIGERVIMNLNSSTKLTPTYSAIIENTCRSEWYDTSCTSCGASAHEGTAKHEEEGECTPEEGEETCEPPKIEVCDYYVCADYYSKSSVETDPKKNYAYARVPYNFSNSTMITSPNTGGTVYAGERKDIYFNITVSPKQNKETNGTYATQVHGSTRKIKIVYQDQNGIWRTTYSNTEDEDLNMGNDKDQFNNGSIISRSESIVIPDLPAGSRIRVYSMVFPKDSGSDNNWRYANGGYDIYNESNWAISNYKEYVIAKRPSIQFWGGNLYSNVNINTGTSIKYHIAGLNDIYYYNNADIDEYDNPYVFGSWVDQAIISNGQIAGMASGAALGYSLGSAETKPGSYCNRVPLSFANKGTSDGLWSPSCSRNAAGGLSSTATTLASTESTIKDKYIYNDGKQTISGNTLLSFRNDASGDIYKGNNTYYYDNQGSISIGNAGTNPVNITVPKDTTQIVYAKDKLTINANLVYGNGYDTETYSYLSAIPKLILYAENEVKINCAVSRIDAIIVAKKVTTLALNDGETENINDQKHSNQLFVNGSIITSNLVANRTYGASLGQNSTVAAEIINFDPSLYQWSRNTVIKNDNGAGDGTSSTEINNAKLNLSTTYQKELAPRY